MQCDAFPKLYPDRTLVSWDDTENMPIPDHQNMITTPWLEVAEEGRGRSIQKVDALALDAKA